MVRFFTKFYTFSGRTVTLIEDRQIMSVKDCLPVQVFHFLKKLQRTVLHGLSALAEHISSVCILSLFKLMSEVFHVAISHRSECKVTE